MLTRTLRAVAAPFTLALTVSPAMAHHPMTGGGPDLVAALSDHAGLGVGHLFALAGLAVLAAIVLAAARAGRSQ